jgi:hypothetical protein
VKARLEERRKKQVERAAVARIEVGRCRLKP